MPLATVQPTSLLEIEEKLVSVRTDPHPSQPLSEPDSRLKRAAILLALACLSISIDGYHPFSEDAGIYVASLKKLARPGLYPSSSPFLAPYTHLSVFSHFGAWLLGFLHLPFETVLFVLHLATTWLLLVGGFGLAKRCSQKRAGRWGGALLLALCASVPVAGSSLSIMDPYLTGRSFSTPFALLALCAILDRSFSRAGLFLMLAVLFHPLMGVYAIGFSLVLWAIQRRSWLGVCGIMAASIVAGAAVQLSQGAEPETAAYRAAVSTRTYFFLSQWHWYEIVGLVAPMLLLAFFGLWKHKEREGSTSTLALSSATMGMIAVTVSILFCHPSSISHRVAALQPLRPFVFIYVTLFVLIGGILGERVLHRMPWRWVAAVILLGVPLGFVQHSIFPASPQLELPGTPSENSWHHAFDWIRSNTAADAVIALDASYIDAPEEDSLGFRAVAERDSLADRAKDGGAAAVFPQLAGRWLLEQTATSGLNEISDPERLRRLAPFHVSWLVLNGNAPTSLLCPFSVSAVKVCQLRYP